MKFSPLSSATRTDLRTSSSVTLRNSAPSEDAPKLRIGTCNPVLPSGRLCMAKLSMELRASAKRFCAPAPIDAFVTANAAARGPLRFVIGRQSSAKAVSWQKDRIVVAQDD